MNIVSFVNTILSVLCSGVYFVGNIPSITGKKELTGNEIRADNKKRMLKDETNTL
jgi:hypothetical protein